jgi:hypothetical protein
VAEFASESVLESGPREITTLVYLAEPFPLMQSNRACLYHHSRDRIT